MPTAICCKKELMNSKYPRTSKKTLNYKAVYDVNSSKLKLTEIMHVNKYVFLFKKNR